MNTSYAKTHNQIEAEVPQDQQAETMVLSAMFQDQEVVGNIVSLLRPDDFADDTRQLLFRTFSELYERGQPLDAVIVESYVAKKKLSHVLTMPYLLEIANAAPSSAMAEYHAILVKEQAIKRRMMQALHASIKDVLSSEDDAKSVTDRVEGRIFAAADDMVSTSHEQSAGSLLVELDKIINNPLTQGIDTGFYELDKLTVGMHKGEMIIIAARPSVGKSAIALNIAEHVSMALGHPVGIFSMEMRNTELMMRLLCSRANVDMQRVKRGTMDAQDLQRMAPVVRELADAPLYIDDLKSVTMLELRAKARRLKMKRGIELLVVDYLQLLEAGGGKSENRQQEISRISRSMKTLAHELDIPVIALSQLNRASENEQRRPRTSDLRESGSLEQDADTVILLHREDFAHQSDPDWLSANRELENVAEVHLAKQRNGPTGMIKLLIQPHCTRFVNMGYGG